MQPALPSLLVPHGPPTFALRPGAAGAALTRMANRLERPRAIVIVSPHWNTAIPTVGTAPQLETIHDFWGFPEELYSIYYPANGSPEAALEVAEALAGAGFPVAQDAGRGLDHGAWMPLRLMFPNVDIPVIPLSLQGNAGTEYAYRIGKALAPLAARGFLIVGSGNLTHNLYDFHIVARDGERPPPYVEDFSDWIARQIERRDVAALIDYRRQAPSAKKAHPTEEHLLPFFVALGAWGNGGNAERFHTGVEASVISMDAYCFQTQGQAP